MGQVSSVSYKAKDKEDINKNRFEFSHVIGRGGFGKVWKVCDKKYKTPYALKEMAKVRIIDKKSEKSIGYERELLSRLKNSFIVNMYYAFQDYENLYLVMDFLSGGDLRYHIARHKKFSEEQTRFFIACILLGLEYIHSHNVLHRDIKPENLVLDGRGYVRITDFGIAKLFSKDNAAETSGTPGYMSPEVLRAQNHTIAVDYFALGVVAYEFMYGTRPYVGKSRKEIKEQIMAKQVLIKPSDLPDGWSEESADFINKLLQRKPECRLGYKGAQEVMEHPWLKYYPWKELLEKKLEAPFILDKVDNFDKKYCEQVEKLGNETLARYEKHKSAENFSMLFRNYTYIFNVIPCEEGKREYTKCNNKFQKFMKKSSSVIPYRQGKSGSMTISDHNVTPVKNNIEKTVKTNIESANKFYNTYLQQNSVSCLPFKDTIKQHVRSTSLLENTSHNNNPIYKNNSNIGIMLSKFGVSVSASKNQLPTNEIGVVSSFNAKISSGSGSTEKLKIAKKTSGTSTSSANILLKNYKFSSNSSNSTGSTATSSTKHFK